MTANNLSENHHINTSENVSIRINGDTLKAQITFIWYIQRTLFHAAIGWMFEARKAAFEQSLIKEIYRGPLRIWWVTIFLGGNETSVGLSLDSSFPKSSTNVNRRLICTRMLAASL